MDRERGFTYDAMPARVVLAEGALGRVGAELERLGGRRAAVIAGGRHRGVAERLVAALGPAVAGVFGQVAPHVPEELAERCRGFVAEQGADAVVSVGGGSAIGLAKAVARDRSLVFVAVPTTYSGSEMTPIWGTTAGGRKRTGRDRAVLPDAVVYDPDLTRSLPARMAATSGLNAVAHCVEAFYGPGANPITGLPAAEGLRRLASALPRVVDGGDPDAHRNALFGACLAGLAVAQAGTSFHHKLCHLLGGRFDLPHAETHAVLLPHSVRTATEAVPRAVRPVAEALGVADPVAGVTALAGRLGAPASLHELGLSAAELDAAVADAPAAVGEAGVEVSRAQLEDLLRGAWSGRPAVR